ncbi:hypothetical protein PMIN01_08839 [Paraphaeosphaeria minitans]|uniref:Uncharacterized protein n=1 Tax=Paraphaeosphaeria minitans TaxID=565426 RepID=A0A9P6GDG1_9PLEO|nr:hypothetical protein PMIN01_08839 [Paraphaeosphaeria minitans]
MNHIEYPTEARSNGRQYAFQRAYPQMPTIADQFHGPWGPTTTTYRNNFTPQSTPLTLARLQLLTSISFSLEVQHQNYMRLGEIDILPRSNLSLNAIQLIFSVSRLACVYMEGASCGSCASNSTTTRCVSFACGECLILVGLGILDPVAYPDAP